MGLSLVSDVTIAHHVELNAEFQPRGGEITAQTGSIMSIFLVC